MSWSRRSFSTPRIFSTWPARRVTSRYNFRKPLRRYESNWRKIMPVSTKREAFSAEERKKYEEMEMLLRIAKQVAAIDSLDELLVTIVEVTAKETAAERGTLFLNDEQTGELYSRVAQGSRFREIRILNDHGIAGNVFTTGVGVIVPDA